MFLRVKVYTSLVVRQIVFLSETSAGLFEQDYHFGPGGKRSPGRARDAKILLARPGSALANASGRVNFSKPGHIYIINVSHITIVTHYHI